MGDGNARRPAFGKGPKDQPPGRGLAGSARFRSRPRENERTGSGELASV